MLARRPQGLLRFLTCGSVDDGKSTLIGRLLHDAGLISRISWRHSSATSRKFGTTGDDLDFALLLDGLEAEREQGITIDVAYRYFATARRAFIVADTPGHEQYTRNMATGASNAELAIILVDARKGMLTQTRRHASICSLLGIRHVVLAVNKMDLVDFEQSTLRRASSTTSAIRGAALASRRVVSDPGLGARTATMSPPRAPQHAVVPGADLLEHLETIDVEEERADRPFRFPVQWVNRPNLDFRGYRGHRRRRHACGPAMPIVVARSGRSAQSRRIVTADGDLASARRRRRRDAHARRRDRRRARRRARASGATAATSPTSSPRT